MSRPLLDDFFDYFGYELDEVAACGMPHPRLDGNYCTEKLEHKGKHQDAAGNEWTGRPFYD